MRTTSGLILVVAVTAAAGCQSTRSPVAVQAPPIAKAAPTVSATPTASAVGKNVQTVIAESSGLRCEFFTLDDKPLEARLDQASGSVSIHAADGSGQDNYRFDASGKIDRHLRSYGSDYQAGVWIPVP